MSKFINKKENELEILLLSLLEKGDCYAYQMVQLIDILSCGYLKFSKSAYYSTLYRLKESGFVSSKDVPYKKQVNIYYHLEDAGRTYFSKRKKEYQNKMYAISSILNWEGDGKLDEE